MQSMILQSAQYILVFLKDILVFKTRLKALSIMKVVVSIILLVKYFDISVNFDWIKFARH